MANSIWNTDPKHWPKASSPFVFLAAAFNEVGKVLFPEEWTGTEALPLQTPLADQKRKLENLLRAQAVRPAATVGGGRSIYRIGGESPKPKTIELPKVDPARREEHLRKQEEALAAEAARNAAILARREEVTEWIASRSREGVIGTFGLWTGGGLPPIELAPSVWFATNEWAIFERCAVTRPSTTPVPYWIFLGRGSLDHQLAATPKPKKSHPSSFRQHDAELYDEMRALISSGKASGPYSAALAVVGRAVGGGSDESRARRLERGYKQAERER